jgi:DNA-binding CsgD family transcriptional regulator
MGEPIDAIAYRQKAYAGYAAEPNDRAAGAVAGRLAIESFMRGQASVGAGWLGRAHRHLDEQPPCPEQGFLAMVEATIQRFAGDLDAALELARRAVDIGQQFGDRDLLAMAIHTEGLIHIDAGRVTEGLAMLDDAMTSVLVGELSPFFTGLVYCNVIGACLELADLRRAGEWSNAARDWCETLPPGSPYPGLCRVHRAEVQRLFGAWAEAEADAAIAAEDLLRFDREDAGHAFYELGEVRRLRGDLPGAEQAFEHARECGSDPQPGFALVRLAQRKLVAATAALRLADTSRAPLQRARLLAAAVEIALAAADVATAAAAAEELEDIAATFATPALGASAATARGAVLLAAGDVPSALEFLRRACGLWQEVKLPYEAARARVLYGRALTASGDEESGAFELRAALATFERLGAAPDAAATTGLLGAPEALPGGLTAREAEVLRLVAAGNTNRDIAVELVISEHTVGRHLQNIYAKLDVSTRAAATAFAFEHDLN